MRHKEGLIFEDRWDVVKKCGSPATDGSVAHRTWIVKVPANQQNAKVKTLRARTWQPATQAPGQGAGKRIPDNVTLYWTPCVKVDDLPPPFPKVWRKLPIQGQGDLFYITAIEDLAKPSAKASSRFTMVNTPGTP